MGKRSSSRRTHVSPGVYYKETVVPYANKSLGITKMGLAGETLKGPAFQAIPISNWDEYYAYFGGTSTEKFRGSQYPKYELPYIAKEFLKKSDQLEVVRTLGLSGVNAGPAWVITATKTKNVSGMSFEQDFNDEGEPVEKSDVNIQGEMSNGFFGNASLSEPKSVEMASADASLASVSVVDAYHNGDMGIVQWDDNAEDYFTILPKGLQIAYKNSGMEGIKEAVGGEPFLYIGFDSGISDGNTSIVYTDGDYAKATLFSGTVESVADPDDNTKQYRYAIITKSQIGTYVDNAHYDANYDFVPGNFDVYQYGWTNNDKIDTNIVKSSGKAYSYTGTFHDKDEDGGIAVEDLSGEYNNVAVAIIRSRGEHKKAVLSGYDNCGNPVYTYDAIEYYAQNVSLKPSSTLVLGDTCIPGYSAQTGDFTADPSNYGRFTIAVDSVKGCTTCGEGEYIQKEYSVSLNPTDKNYITKVIGTDPELGDADVYVEELYDVALEQLILSGDIDTINHELAYYPAVTLVPSHAPVDDLLRIDPNDLTKRHLNKRYIYTYSESAANGINVRVTTDNGAEWSDERPGIVGHIYTVCVRVNKETGKKEYFYGEYRDANGGILTGSKKFTDYLTFMNYHKDVVETGGIMRNCVKVMSDRSMYILKDFSDNDTANDGEVVPVTLDFNNYKEPYRYASTPWIVSEVKGSGDNIKLHRLFRFHTISDGDESSFEVKVSIENIDPENEVFDVVVRAFGDSDYNPTVLERYSKCNLVPGTQNYIGLRIGTFDEAYSVKSAYITVEINEDDVTAQSIPCGFLGYPVRNYSGTGIYEVKGGTLSTEPKQPYIRFNTTIDEEVKARKQYFGMSDLVGIDEDMLSYKGVEAYSDDPEYLTPCFHLDARILNGAPVGERNGNWYTEDMSGNKQVVDVDGVTGYNWLTVSMAETTQAGIEPRIGMDDVMQGTIYEDKAFRKFTVCFYGGWDGWDYYRTSRSNSDEYRYNKYKGSIDMRSGQGSMFSVVQNPAEYGFSEDTKVITSDYYAYLAAVRQLDNPKTVAINLMATPGIDYVNQTALVGDIIDIAEEDRGDVLYIVTTPDKPYGAGDSKSEMYTPEDAVYNLEATEIDTNYACTYYPWVKYFDADNSQYIYLPVTCDVARNMAYTDNIFYPWYAAAGWNRGDVTGVEPKRKLKLGEQDTLYDGRINFVNSFAKEGNRIWGDKNLQVEENIMNRISKRRLLIRLKTLLSNACVGLLFDPNDSSMVESLRSAIKSVLDPIRKNRGITDYYIEVDDSAEARDRLELPAKIGIKPTQMLEYITIDLQVTPQGVNWE